MIDSALFFILRELDGFGILYTRTKERKTQMAQKPSTDGASSAKKSGTTIRKCVKGCAHVEQDKLYSGARLHNLAGGGTKARCTVCGNVVDLR